MLIATSKYPTASAREINKLKSLVRKVDHVVAQEEKTKELEAQNPAPPQPAAPPPLISNRQAAYQERLADRKVFDSIKHAEVTRDVLKFDNPVEWLLFLKPEITPYRWQFEELMRIAGYIHTGKYGPEHKTRISKDAQYRLILAAANGSGKDAIFIAAAATWFAVCDKPRNRAIITSSSFEQVKFQTEPAIQDLVKRANSKCGKLFKSVQFHHIVPELGSEIKLFATDDPGHAEGYHAWDQGSVMRIINEAKSVHEDIFKAMFRWRGVSHHLEVSSPGQKSGHMYNSVKDAIHYPTQCELNKYFYRKVSAYDCPHISQAEIQAMFDEYGESSPLVQSSIFANFSDFDEPVIINETLFDKCALNPPLSVGDDIGIGLDLAGGGDEDACFVRKGNTVIKKFFFRQADTDLAADLIDMHLDEYRGQNYVFRADNGGIGQGIIDKLVTKGWHITRTNNQSPARNKRLFLNLGAEVWYHIKRLIEKNAIVLPTSIPKFKEQMCSRRWLGLDSTQGKLSLESKKEAKANGRPSPDRADAFNLCFYSYRSNTNAQSTQKPSPNLLTINDLLALSARGQLSFSPKAISSGRFTILNNKI